MAMQVIVPGEGGDGSCFISEWSVKEGDKVGFGDMLCSVETDKTSVDIVSPCEGIVLKILYQQGEEAPVLQPIAYVGKEGETVDVPVQPKKEEPAASVPETEKKQPEKEDKELVKAPAPATVAETAAPAVQKPANILKTPVKTPVAGAPASPKARQIAEEYGISLDGVAGTGMQGSIVFDDVKAFIKEAVKHQQGNIDNYYEKKPLSGARKVTAMRMMESLQNSAQFTLNTEVCADTVLTLRKRFKESGDKNGFGKVTINDLILYAVSRALAKHPEVNAVWNTENELFEFSHVNLGVAVATDHGLLVPVIKNADTKSLLEISQETAALIAKAKDRKLKPEEMSDGTFTVTNLGSKGITSFTPIINRPQVAILGVCAPVSVPVVKGDKWAESKKMTLSLTVDHRAIDGAPGAEFLQDVVEYLQSLDIQIAFS